MGISRHLKIFISSTFEDMDSERQVLLTDTFVRFRKLAKRRDVEVTEIDLRTGITKEQADSGQILKICLEQVKRCEDSPIFFLGMLGHRYGSIEWYDSMDKRTLEDEQYRWIEKYKNRSITELEIESALRNSHDNRAFFYIKSSQENEEPKLRNLKKKLIEGAKENDKLSLEYYESDEVFKQKTYDALASALNELYPEDEKLSKLEKLRQSHNLFAKSRQKSHYIPHSKNEEILDNFIASDKDRMLLYGESGYGKSALIANYFKTLKEQKSHFIIEHYIGGAGEGSSDFHQMLSRVMLEMKEQFDLPDELPTKPQKIVDEFTIWLHNVKSPTIIIFDGYNQIEDESKERFLKYYLSAKYENVKIIITSIRDDYEIEHKYQIEALSQSEQRGLILKYQKSYGKTLDDNIIEEIVNHPQTDNALFLETLLNEIRLLGKFDKQPQEIANYLNSKDIVELFDKIFERLERDYTSPKLVRDLLSLLYTSRDGLSETNLIEIINQEYELLPLDFYPLFLAIEEHLVDSSGLYKFFHGYIEAAVKQRYLDSDKVVNVYRRKIADYFEARVIDNQRVRELPFQLFKLEDKYQLYCIYLDLDFFIKSLTEYNYSEILKYYKYINSTYNLHLQYKQEFQKYNINEVYVLILANFFCNFYQDLELSTLLYKNSLIHKTKLNIYSYIGLSNVYIEKKEPEKVIELIENKLFNKVEFNHLKKENQSLLLLLLAQSHNMLGFYEETVNFLTMAESIDSSPLLAYEIKIEKGILFINLEEYGLSIKEFNSAYTLIEKYIGNDSIPHMLTHENNICVVYKNMENYPLAYNSFKSILRKSISFYGYKNEKNTKIYMSLAECLVALSEFKNAEFNYKKALVLQNKIYSYPHKEIIHTFNALEQLYFNSFYLNQEIFKQEKLLSFLLKRLKLEKKRGSNYDDLGVRYGMIGMFYQNIRRDCNKGIYYFKKSFDIVNKIENNYRNLAPALNNISTCYRVLNDKEKSLYYMHKSIVASENIEEFSDEQRSIQYNNYADVLFNFEKYEDALINYKIALDYYKLDEDNIFYKLGYGYINNIKAQIKFLDNMFPNK